MHGRECRRSDRLPFGCRQMLPFDKKLRKAHLQHVAKDVFLRLIVERSMEVALDQALSDRREQIIRQETRPREIMLVDQLDDRVGPFPVVEHGLQAIAGEIEFQNVRQLFRFHVVVERLAQFRLLNIAEKLLA